MTKQVFMLFDLDKTKPDNNPCIGTAFSVKRSNLLLTAAHVVRDIERILVTCTYYSPLVNYKVDKVVSHPRADLAALYIKNNSKFGHFDIGNPSDVYPNYDEYPLAEDILSYGFPLVGNEKPIKPRMMKGHIQSKYDHTSPDRRYKYRAYELSFPAFPGLSGSPVFRDLNNRNEVIGIVTDRISFCSEQNNHETRMYITVATALFAFVDWIQSL